MELEQLRLEEFGKGLNRSLSDREIAKNQAWTAENCFLDEEKIAKRQGYSKLNSVALASASIITVYQFYKEDTGVSYFLAQCGTSLYSINLATGVSSLILDGLLTANYPLTYATINNLVYMSNGKDSVYKWDGATPTEVNGGDFPKAKFITVHRDKLFFTHIATASVSYPADPNIVYFSQAGTPETIDSDAHFIVYTTDGDILTGMVSLFSYLILFKTYSTHRLQGISKEELILTSNLVDAYPSIGCISHRSIARAPGGIFFAAMDGIYYFDGNTMIPISENVESFLDEGLASYTDKFCGFWDGKHYRVAYPTGTSITPNETLVANPKGPCWTLFTYGMNDFIVTRDRSIYGAGDDGFVYKVDDGLSDDGADIAMRLLTKVFDFGVSHMVKVFRKANIDTHNTQATLEFTTIVDRGVSSWMSSAALSSTRTVWGTFNWAISTGTVAVTNGSPNVTGSGVVWDNVQVGDSFVVDSDGTTYTVLSFDAVAGTLVLTENYAGVDASGETFCIWNDFTLFWEEPGLIATRISYPKTIRGRLVQFQFREEGSASQIEIYGINIRFRAIRGEK